jgi:hypothetical protein
MICRTDQEQFDEGTHTGQFSANLSMPHPFGKKKGYPAAENNSQIKKRQLYIKEKSGQKYSGTNLMAGPDQDREIQDPIGPVPDSPHFIIPTTLRFLHFSRCSSWWPKSSWPPFFNLHLTILRPTQKQNEPIGVFRFFIDLILH